jgi:hypothetical protein
MAMKSLCKIDGCGKPARNSRGWCAAHYERWRIHGSPLGGRTERGELVRWLENIALPFSGDECLTWPFCRTPKGYGHIKVEGRKGYAHRFVCERANGVAPTPKHEAAHSCGNSSCVNPLHLRWATTSQNHADKLIHDTHRRGERHYGARLTEAGVRLIRANPDMLSQSELASAFGVSRATVSSVLRRDTWSWLDDQK